MRAPPFRSLLFVESDSRRLTRRLLCSNGGPVDLAENAANNWPKRGGKYSLFEGGISVAAFVSGGFLPPAVRGTVNNGIVHIADWYATFLSFSHLDPTDKRAAAAGNIPPIDRCAQKPFPCHALAG